MFIKMENWTHFKKNEWDQKHLFLDKTGLIRDVDAPS